MPDLDKVTPVNKTEGDKDTEQGVAVATPAPEAAKPTPPPSNAERAAAKADAAKDTAAVEEADGTPEDPAKEQVDGAKEAEDLNTEVWGDHGTDEGNAVLQTLQNSGVKPEEAKALLWDAVEAGDPKLVDRDALVEKVGKANATLIMAGIENVTTKNNQAIAEVKAIAHSAAGDEASWNKAVTWAREAIPENELGDFRDMISRGGQQAKYAVSAIVERYNADPKNTALSAGKGKVTPDGVAVDTVKGISRIEYGQQLDILHRKGVRQDHPEFKALQARRAAGLKQGL